MKNQSHFHAFGNYAKNKEKFIHDNNHLILKVDIMQLSTKRLLVWWQTLLKCNDFLIKQNMMLIKWV